MRTETTSKTSLFVEWSLSEVNFCDSLGLFSVYFMFGKYESLAGTTKAHFLEILELVALVNYTVRVELQFPYSSLIISATTHHLLALNGDTIPPNTNTQSTSSCITTVFPTQTHPDISYAIFAFLAVLVLLAAILILVLLICVLIVCAMKIRTKRKAKQSNGNDTSQFPLANPNEIYQHVHNIPAIPHNTKMLFFYREC